MRVVHSVKPKSLVRPLAILAGVIGFLLLVDSCIPRSKPATPTSQLVEGPVGLAILGFALWIEQRARTK